MAAPVLRYSQRSHDLGDNGTPNDGDLAVAVICTSTVPAAIVTGAASGWTFGGSIASAAGGVMGDRVAGIAVAWRVWRTGDELDAEPFTFSGGGNVDRSSAVYAGATYAEAAFAVGSTPAAALPAALLWATQEAAIAGVVAFPRSTSLATSEYPNPPFGAVLAGGTIGTGFSNVSGYRSSGYYTGRLFPSWDAAEGTEDVWASALVIVTPDTRPPPPPPPPPEGDPAPGISGEGIRNRGTRPYVRGGVRPASHIDALKYASAPGALRNDDDTLWQNDDGSVSAPA